MDDSTQFCTANESDRQHREEESGLTATLKTAQPAIMMARASSAQNGTYWQCTVQLQMHEMPQDTRPMDIHWYSMQPSWGSAVGRQACMFKSVCWLRHPSGCNVAL